MKIFVFQNYTVLRYAHYLVSHMKQFEEVKISFPIRGHSFMECDRDMALIKSKLFMETPSEWYAHMRDARKSSSPFKVIEVNHGDFYNYTKFFSPLFKKLCPIKVRPIREIFFKSELEEIVEYRENFVSRMTPVTFLPRLSQQTFQDRRLEKLYTERLPVSLPKQQDVLSLLDFCKPESRMFFENLPTGSNTDPLVSSFDRYEDRSEQIDVEFFT